MRRLSRAAAVALALTITSEAAAQGAAAKPDITVWLNNRIDSLVAGRIMQSDRGKAPQLPAGTASRASIIDRAAIPEIAGISVALPSQPGPSGGALPPSTSLGTSPYMLLALAQGNNPLDPATYLRSALSRHIGLSTTWDSDPATGKSVPTIQARWQIIDRANPLSLPGEHPKKLLDSLDKKLDQASKFYGPLQQRVVMILWHRVGEPNGIDSIAYANALTNGENTAKALSAAGAAGLKEIDEAILAVIERFVSVRAAIDDLVSESRKRPQLTLGFTQSGLKDNKSMRVAVIYDIGRPWYDLTFNAIYNNVRAPGVSPENRAEAAVQFLLRLTQDNALAARTPMSIAVAGSGSKSFEGKRESVFKLQTLMLVPLGDGVNVPLSATWASKASLVQESRVVGNVGFSFDVGQIFNAGR
ncbi:MAG TPA: hypothetical protein VF483_12935 [Gemmatimonadaceae bacterium]